MVSGMDCSARTYWRRMAESGTVSICSLPRWRPAPIHPAEAFLRRALVSPIIRVSKVSNSGFGTSRACRANTWHTNRV